MILFDKILLFWEWAKTTPLAAFIPDHDRERCTSTTEFRTVPAWLNLKVLYSKIGAFDQWIMRLTSIKLLLLVSLLSLVVVLNFMGKNWLVSVFWFLYWSRFSRHFSSWGFFFNADLSRFALIFSWYAMVYNIPQSIVPRAVLLNEPSTLSFLMRSWLWERHST